MANFPVELTQGDDLFPSSDFPDVPQGDSVSVVAFEGNDTVGGTSLGDLILGNGGNDSLTGNNGDDTIYGGQGNDFISDLSGNNLLIGNLGNDIITGGAGDDSIFGGQGSDTISAGAGDDTVYAGQDNDTVIGGEGKNLLAGNMGDDEITGGADADTIYGGQDNDTITAGAGADEILGGKGDDLIVVNAGDVVAGEILNGQDGTDTLSVLGNNDISTATVAALEAITLADGVILTTTLVQANSVETISTEGTATLKINATAAQILASGIFDKVSEGVIVEDAEGVAVTPPPKVITGTEEADLLEGTDEAEIINGLGGDDTILAAGGNDTIDAGNGDDAVWAGAGTDIVVGGAGDDTLGIGAEGDATPGETYDGGEGIDQLWVDADADVSGSTVSNIEILSIQAEKTLTVNLDQVDATSAISIVSAFDGPATLKIDATTEEILASDVFTKVAEGVTVQNVNGDVVTPPPVGIIGTEGPDLISPTAPAPLTTTDQADTIEGLGGNDTIDGAGGADDIKAGLGDDLLVINAGDVVAGEAIDGQEGSDTLSVKGNNDISIATVAGIEAITLADSVMLTSTLEQANSVETISAEADASATLKINASATDIVASDIFTKIGDGITVLDADGNVVESPANKVMGTDAAELISTADDADFNSTNGKDDIDALGGNDTINGAGGDDTIKAGDGDDQAWGGTGLDSIEAGAGADTLGINVGDVVEGEVYNGGEGEDKILATGGGEIDLSVATLTSVEELNLDEGNTVIASLENLNDVTKFSANIETEDAVATIKILGTTEQIEALLGGIEIVGGAESGLVVQNIDGEQVFPVPTAPPIDGTAGNDTLTGTESSELISGFAGDDILTALAGNDTLDGGADNDTLDGGVGQDSVLGGLGDDNFVVNTGDVEAGETYDGGDGRDTLSVLSDSDLSVATLSSVEIIDASLGVTAIVSQANLDQGGSVEVLSGSGTIQAAPNPDDPAAVVTLDLTGITVGAKLTIKSSDGTVVQAPETDNPDDPDKLRPIVYTLKVGSDNTSFNGRANAPLENSNIGTVPTLETGDVLQGIGETDLLTARFNTNSNLSNIGNVQPILNGVEKVNITTSTNTLNYVASQTSGTEEFVSSDSSALLSISDIPEIPTKGFTLTNAFFGGAIPVGTGGGLDATIRNSVLSGSSDAITVTLQNAKLSGAAISLMPVTGTNGFETFNIVSSTPVEGSNNDNVIDSFVATNSLTTVNLSGDQNLTIEANLANPSLPNSVKTIDASALTGNLVISAAPNSALTFTGGEGNDYINFDKGVVGTDNLLATDTVDGGGGTNTVKAIYTGAPASVGPLKLTNIQNFYVDTRGDVSLNLEDVDSITKLRLVNGDNSKDDLTITNIKSSPTEIEFTGNGVVAIQNLDNLSQNSSVLTGSADSATVNISNSNNLDNASYYELNQYNVVGNAFLTLNGYETINFNVSNGNVNTTIVGGVPTPAGGAPSDIISSTLQSINFTGANIRVGNLGGTSRTVTSIDASAVTGFFSAGGINSLKAGATVLLSQGSSFFDASLSDPNSSNPGTGVTITGGAGKDTITGTMDNDILTGGAGADVITLSTGADIDRVIFDQTTSTDQVNEFTSGQDKIALTASVYGSASAALTVVTPGGATLPATSNNNATILSDNAANLAAASAGDASNAVKFAFNTGTGKLHYSSTGDFANLASTQTIADLFTDAGATFAPAVVSADFVAI